MPPILRSEWYFYTPKKTKDCSGSSLFDALLCVDEISVKVINLLPTMYMGNTVLPLIKKLSVPFIENIEISKWYKFFLNLYYDWRDTENNPSPAGWQ